MSSIFTARSLPLPLAAGAETNSPRTVQTPAPPAQPFDETLLTTICLGSKEALAVLFKRYAKLVWVVGRRILRDGGEADDLVQEVFLYIYRRSDLFDPSKGSARSWIVQVTYTQALLRRRELKNHGMYASAITDGATENRRASDNEAHYDQTVEAFFGRVRWKKLWNGLTEDQRETFRLHFFEGCTFLEIAERLGQSYANIRNHYYRGLERFRKHAEEGGLSWP